jgi:hypothetical protein
VEGVFDVDDNTLVRLALAIRDRRDPAQALIIAPHAPRYFALAAKVAYDPRHLPDEVKASIAARLAQAFGYRARSLAQSVSAAEVIAAIQGVAGVHHLDLTTWNRSPRARAPWSETWRPSCLPSPRASPPPRQTSSRPSC